MANKETLLIVEDNHDLRNGLKEILSFEGFTVFAAANGREALEHMSGVTPDLILSDITMPEMDGYEFFEAIRARPDGITIPFIFLTARGEYEEMMHGKSLGAEDYLVKPVSRSELLAAIQAKLTRFRQLQLAQLEQVYQDSLTLLANAIELRDEYTRGHVERVTAYSVAIAEYLGWRGRKLQMLRLGAILHDIGKMFVNEGTWLKAGPLDEQERAEVMQHPVKGAEMIQRVPYLEAAVPVVRHHHERWDGKGYPDGLVGAAIPIEARIVAIADSFDAITTTRPYHDAASLQEAYEEIMQGAGTFYDPIAVRAFGMAWKEQKIHAISQRWQETAVEIEKR